MPRFTPDFLERLRERLPVSQVVSRTVKLRPGSKGEFTGLCPFHQEKTPSFTVSDDKGFYHCFGCGAHGDVIRFVTESERLSFNEAVEKLAAQAGLPLPRAFAPYTPEIEKAKSLKEAMEAACLWYQERLKNPEGRTAREYLEERECRPETIATFRLGFSPAGGGLHQALLKQGFDPEILKQAGLTVRTQEGQMLDRFRGRIMFPIADRKGKVIAFGGRALNSARGQPKYLNSPETPLFHKGHILYNTALAFPSARKRQQLLVVEGYMDVIMLHQFGIDYAVAPLGTALTEHHIKECWQVAPEPVCCFDGDAAGKRAALRLSHLALPYLEAGKSWRFIFLPPEHDPDSFVREKGPAIFEEMIGQASPLSEMLWETESASQTLDTPERRADLRKRLIQLSAQVRDFSVQKLYREYFEGKFRQAFSPAFTPFAKTLSPATPSRNLKMTKQTTLEQLEWRLLGLICLHPDLLQEGNLAEELGLLTFSNGKLDKLRDTILQEAALEEISSPQLLERLDRRGYEKECRRLNPYDAFDRFSKPETSRDVALSGWHYLLSLYHLEKMRVHYEQASRKSASHEDAEKLWELKQQMVSLEKEVARRAYEATLE